ncbi:plasmid mobilization relaxosome protein MobC [Rathayibacter caricis]|uniref:plasmid mobilization protein n=1 Tax=Rathayibacter caricis TaxID=110936 RepID=UPI001FB25875|nr:plasmid mobilization relaxosome protein MobC [Rathayibacter caricis]MCJ1697815.1 plasmid mobilization relaxosome protein MobC [Rathayibacter caricis]
MTESSRLFGRKRRPNVPAEQRREKKYVVRVSPDEDAMLRARAEVLDVTVPRLMFEAAIDPQVRSDVEWKSVGSELMQLRTLMGRLSSNMNQLARFANTEGRFPEEAVQVAAEYRALVPRVNETLRRLAGQ